MHTHDSETSLTSIPQFGMLFKYILVSYYYCTCHGVVAEWVPMLTILCFQYVGGHSVITGFFSADHRCSAIRWLM